MKTDRHMPRYDFEMHMFLVNQHLYPQPLSKGLANCPACRGEGIVLGVICQCWEIYVNAEE